MAAFIARYLLELMPVGGGEADGEREGGRSSGVTRGAGGGDGGRDEGTKDCFSTDIC
jgi:hypothetical protein